MARKTPQERGYTIPVVRKLAPGRYQKAYANPVTTQAGKVRVCFDSGRTSQWPEQDAIRSNFDRLETQHPHINIDQ